MIQVGKMKKKNILLFNILHQHFIWNRKNNQALKVSKLNFKQMEKVLKKKFYLGTPMRVKLIEENLLIASRAVYKEEEILSFKML